MNIPPLTITLIGGPTALLELGGARILTDPTFDPPGAYDAGAIVLNKTAGPALTAESVGHVDLVLLSHGQHFDNLDRAGRVYLKNAGRVLTTNASAAELGPPAEGLKPGDEIEIKAKSGVRLHVTALPARHGPIGVEPISGEVIGFMLCAARAAKAIYVSGDTVWYAGLAETARGYDVALAILFTGSAKPRGAFRMTMDCNEAIEAAHALRDARIVAIHNQGWAHFTESQEDLAQAFAAMGLRDRLTLLTPGEPVTIAGDLRTGVDRGAETRS
jgi:L-ascorbate metabolism protein UlaG (beta-lactamase superfamily)